MQLRLAERPFKQCIHLITPHMYIPVRTADCTIGATVGMQHTVVITYTMDAGASLHLLTWSTHEHIRIMGV